MRTNKRVTSVDVATESGVSQATVARAFNSPQLVSPHTLDRVRAAADQLGYVPNAIARSLKSQRSNIVGAVVPTHGEYWQHVLTAFSRQLAQRSKQLLLFSVSGSGGVDDVLGTVAQYQLDGIVLASAQIGHAQLARMQQSPVPTVAFNQPAASGVIPSVSVDNSLGASALAEHLVSQGCRSALFVGGMSSASTDERRYRGAAESFGAADVALPYLEAGAFSYEAGYKIAGEILEREALPDALVVAGDELAFGVLDGLRSSGVHAPDDVLITGFDGLPQASWHGYDLTTVVQPVELLVESALELLDEAPEQQPDRERETDVVVTGTVRVGNTTRRK